MTNLSIINQTPANKWLTQISVTHFSLDFLFRSKIVKGHHICLGYELLHALPSNSQKVLRRSYEHLTLLSSNIMPFTLIQHYAYESSSSWKHMTKIWELTSTSVFIKGLKTDSYHKTSLGYELIFAFEFLNSCSKSFSER